MKCNIALAASLLFTAHAAVAGTMGTQVPYDGFYIGADVGLANIDVKEFALANSLTKPETHHLGDLGFVGGGVLGYDYSINDQFKLGIEGFINGNTAEAKAIHDFNSTVMAAKARYNAGVRVLPGYLFTPETNGHIILGYTNAGYRVTDNGVYGFVDNQFNLNGFQAGLGMTANLTPNVSLRLDAIYSTYGSQDSIGTMYTAVDGPAGAGSGVGPANGIANVYHNTFQTLEGNLTLIYKFL